MLLSVAVRNLSRTPKRTYIILALQVAIVTLFFLGNAILLQSDTGLQKSFIDNFTGDAMVKVPSDLPVSIFGAITPSIGELFTIPELPDHDAIKTHLIAQPEIDGVISLISGMAELKLDSYRVLIPIFGVDATEYFDFFSGLRIVDGSYLKGNQPGVIISRKRSEEIADRIGHKLIIGEPILFSTYGNEGFRIRELPLTGIMTYENSSGALDEIVLMDAQTLRELNNVSIAVDSAYVPRDDAVSLIDENLDDLFGKTTFSAPDSESELTLNELFEVMADTGDSEDKLLTGGAWHFLLLRYSGYSSPMRSLKHVNEILSGTGLEAVDWREAAGLSALLVLLLRVVFNGGFILVVSAGIIAMVNILVISVIERTGEIGTLRAVGATRAYVRRLLILENLLLACISGILAVILGAAVLLVFNRSEIELSNSLLRSLFGNTVLEVRFSSTVAIISLVLSLGLGVIASWFPTVLALRIQPVRAIDQD